MIAADTTASRRAPRLRRLAAIAGALSAALVLSACAGSGEAPSPAPTSAADVRVVDEGPAVMAAAVTGEFGDEPETTLPPLDAVGDDIERHVVIEGEGPELTADDTVAIKWSVHNLESGESLGPHAYVGQPVALGDPSLPGYVSKSLIGTRDGSRVVAVVPAVALGASSTDGMPAVLAVFDTQLLVTGAAADGAPAPADATASLVEVSTEPGVEPEITVHSGKEGPGAAEQLTDAILVGDGPVVAEGDLVTVQYTGLLLSDGTEFDSSWSRGGTPTSFATTQVVPGFANALVGQKVGSRVVTVFGPDLGYGEGGSSSIPPGSTLIFVIDILATM